MTGIHRHEAAYRHGGEYRGGEYRREAAGGPDRAIAVAIETAVSQRAFELARAAGDRRDNGPGDLPRDKFNSSQAPRLGTGVEETR